MDKLNVTHESAKLLRSTQIDISSPIKDDMMNDGGVDVSPLDQDAQSGGPMTIPAGKPSMRIGLALMTTAYLLLILFGVFMLRQMLHTSSTSGSQWFAMIIGAVAIPIAGYALLKWKRAAWKHRIKPRK